jgi:hypothetical protein
VEWAAGRRANQPGGTRWAGLSSPSSSRRLPARSGAECPRQTSSMAQEEGLSGCSRPHAPALGCCYVSKRKSVQCMMKCPSAAERMQMRAIYSRCQQEVLQPAKQRKAPHPGADLTSSALTVDAGKAPPALPIPRSIRTIKQAIKQASNQASYVPRGEVPIPAYPRRP